MGTGAGQTAQADPGTISLCWISLCWVRKISGPAQSSQGMAAAALGR